MSGFDTNQARENAETFGPNRARLLIHYACDEIDRLRVTLTATENALRAASGVLYSLPKSAQSKRRSEVKRMVDEALKAVSP